MRVAGQRRRGRRARSGTVGLRPDQARVLAILGIAPVLRARVGALQAKGGGARFQHGPETLTAVGDTKRFVTLGESRSFFLVLTELHV